MRGRGRRLHGTTLHSGGSWIEAKGGDPARPPYSVYTGGCAAMLTVRLPDELERDLERLATEERTKD